MRAPNPVLSGLGSILLLVVCLSSTLARAADSRSPAQATVRWMQCCKFSSKSSTKERSARDATPEHTYGDLPFRVKAVSNSPGLITYALVSGKASVTADGIVTLTGASEVTIEALQAATVDYTSTTQQTTFLVAPGTPIITFDVPDQSQLNSFPLFAKSTSTGFFTYSVVSGPATVNGNTVTPSGEGKVTLRASEAADENYLAGFKDVTFSIQASVLTVEANNATRTYGEANPAFSGLISGGLRSDTFLETFASAADATAAPGSYPIIPTAIGADLSSYAVHTINGVLTILKAPTLITLKTQGQTPNTTTSSIMAQVASTTSGTPTGTVTFLDNGTSMQTVPLVGGYAQLETTLSPGMEHVITATFSGDSNYLGTTTGSALNINPSPQDFTFTVEGSAKSIVSSGENASYDFVLSTLGGSYSGPVTFTVSGLPTDAMYTITPSTIFPGPDAAHVHLAIQTAIKSSRVDWLPTGPRNHKGGMLACVLLAFFGLGTRRKVTNQMLTVMLFLLSVYSIGVMTGCATVAIDEAPRSYSISIVASSGATQHVQNVVLEVQ